MGIEKRALGGIGFALNERKGDVAAEDDAAGAGNAVVEACGHRADAGDRHDAERDTGDEDAEAAQAAAQFAPGKTQCKGHRSAVQFDSRRQHQRTFGMTRIKMKCVGR